MEAVTLLHRAQEAGLRIELMGDTLLVRGPKRAEAVVKLLAEHKAEVLAALSPSFVDAGWWRERFTAKAVQWFVGGRDWDAAKRLAWGDLENDWHASARKALPFMAMRRVRRTHWRLAGAKSSRWQSCAFRTNRLPDPLRQTLARRGVRGTYRVWARTT